MTPQTNAHLHLKTNPIEELKNLRLQIKALSELEEQVKERINNLLDSSGNEELVINGHKVSRVITERVIFDSKTFKTLHPSLYTDFSKRSTSISLKTL